MLSNQRVDVFPPFIFGIVGVGSPRNNTAFQGGCSFQDPLFQSEAHSLAAGFSPPFCVVQIATASYLIFLQYLKHK